MTPDVTRFVDLLIDATSRIEGLYYALPVAGQHTPIYRERVYAYELYHQLRSRWPDPAGWPFVSNGEVDKRSHQIMRGDEVTNRIPDLLVHRPGSMEGNLVILEIKAINAATDAIADDLRKLAAFCNLGYRLGVLLFFGSESSRDELLRRCTNAMRRAANTADLEKTLVLWHSAPGVAATVLEWEAAV